MQALLAKRRDDRGFTLIELLVVLLIIGILISIAIPSFFGARKTAQDTAAKATLRNALTAAKVWYVKNGGDYTDLDSTSAQTGCTSVSNAECIEPSLPWADIDIKTASGNVLKLEYVSKSGATCVLDDSGTAVTITGCD